MARRCAEKRYFSFDCVKRWRCIFALFPFNSLLTHPEALRVSSSEMTQTRAPEFANQCKLCSEHIIRSPIRKANIRLVWRKREKEKMRNEVNSMRENFLDKQTQALRARDRSIPDFAREIMKSRNHAYAPYYISCTSEYTSSSDVS